MIFDSDLVIAVVILTIGMAFFTTSLVEHSSAYQDVIKSNILHDRASYELKAIIADGTVETALILMNNNEDSTAESLIADRLHLKNYEFIIDGETVVSSGNRNDQNVVMVSSVIIMNRSEGWYGVAWDNGGDITISGPETSEQVAYQSVSGDYKKAIYYFNDTKPLKVSLKVYGS